jgi:hypothetical protein
VAGRSGGGRRLWRQQVGSPRGGGKRQALKAREQGLEEAEPRCVGGGKVWRREQGLEAGAASSAGGGSKIFWRQRLSRSLRESHVIREEKMIELIDARIRILQDMLPEGSRRNFFVEDFHDFLPEINNQKPDTASISQSSPLTSFRSSRQHYLCLPKIGFRWFLHFE